MKKIKIGKETNRYEYYSIYRVNAIVECPDGCTRKWNYAVLSSKNRAIVTATNVLRGQPMFQKDYRLKKVEFPKDWQMSWRDDSLELLVDKEAYQINKRPKKEENRR